VRRRKIQKLERKRERKEIFREKIKRKEEI
jgi:hypothetical protein